MTVCERCQSSSSGLSFFIPSPKRFCPKCCKNLDCVPSDCPCPRCERRQTPKCRKPDTPIIMSMSEEFLKENRLRPSTELDRRPRGCPCCLANKKKCDTCIRSTKYKQMQVTSTSTLDQSDICSLASSRPRSRYSMYSSRYSMYGSLESLKRVRKSSFENFRRLSRQQRKSNEYHNLPSSAPTRSSAPGRSSKVIDDNLINDHLLRRPKTARQQKKSQMEPINDDENRRKSELKKGKKGRKSDKRESVREMTCEEKLAEIQAKLKARRRTRPRPLKALNVKSRYSYRFGKRFPGIKVGHRECITDRGLVPCNMGWLWNVPTLGIDRVRELYNFYILYS